MSGVIERNRSVKDYETEEALRRALLAMELTDVPATFDNTVIPPNLDWVLPSYDPETTEVQSMRQELKRLQVLDSYDMLDAEREEAFERVTGVAARIFNVPIALVSLVDLGRQWFMSNRGLGDARETPRKYAFCAHAILAKSGILVVPDATKDFRFQNNPLVTGPPNIRFYAGAPLISPEGYNLGTLCVIDIRTRPDGLSLEEQATLSDLAEMVVEAMVHRRKHLRTQEHPAQLVAYTAHDLMTPLAGVQLSLSLLNDDEDVRRKLEDHQLELLTTASTCSDLMIRICRSAMESLQISSSTSSDLPVFATSDEATNNVNNYDNVMIVKMDELIRSLHMIMEPIPKQVPLVIRLDPAVPPRILSDDLKLFRSALNLLSSAAARTKSGFIQLKIYPKENGLIVFECEDTADDVAVEEYQYLFQPSRADDGHLRMSLSSVASLIGSLGGQFGFRPRVDRTLVHTLQEVHSSGSIFWFNVPLFAPGKRVNTDFVGKRNIGGVNGDQSAGLGLSNRSPSEIIGIRRSQSSDSMNSIGKKRKATAVMNALSASALDQSRLQDANESKHSDSESACSRQEGNDRMVTVPQQITMFVNSIDNDTTPANQSSLDAVSVRSRRVLVIEKSELERKSLTGELNKMGFDVHQANNGLDGLQKMKEELFDFVLCETSTPIMDGFECVKQYREWEALNRSWFRQLIVGMSNDADEDVPSQCLGAGMDDFKPKPISFNDLVEMQESDAVGCRSYPLDERTGLVGGHVIDDHGKPIAVIQQKRARTNSDLGFNDPVCLIATDHPIRTSNDVLVKLESTGWKVALVNDGVNALRLLKMRNWDLTLIDDDLPLMNGFACVSEYREWEAEYRSNRQKNIVLVSDLDIPSPFDRYSIVQAPSGFDYVIRKPILWDDLMQLVTTGHKDAAKVEFASSENH